MNKLLRRIGDDLVFNSWGNNGESTYLDCVEHSGDDPRDLAAELTARSKRVREAQYQRLIQYAAAQRGQLHAQESLRALEAAKDLEWKIYGRNGMMTAYHTALTLHELGRYADEVETLKEGLKSQPGYQEGLYQLGLAYEKLNRRDDARAQFAAAARRPPTADQLRALNDDQRAKWEKALAALRAKFREYGIDAPGY
jgi:tetratricopeptide (TPR) repeat protein